MDFKRGPLCAGVTSSSRKWPQGKQEGGVMPRLAWDLLGFPQTEKLAADDPSSEGDSDVHMSKGGASVMLGHFFLLSSNQTIKD